MRYLKLEIILPVIFLGAGGIFGLYCALAAGASGQTYEHVDGDLEPFKTAFNAASDNVRVVLLVGPT